MRQSRDFTTCTKGKNTQVGQYCVQFLVIVFFPITNSLTLSPQSFTSHHLLLINLFHKDSPPPYIHYLLYVTRPSTAAVTMCRTYRSFLQIAHVFLSFSLFSIFFLRDLNLLVPDSTSFLNRDPERWYKILFRWGSAGSL